jgi:hypothetical protein
MKPNKTKWMSKLMLLSMSLSIYGGISVTHAEEPNQTTVSQAQEYDLELSRWGIFNDGTHPTETTKGINDALQWASSNGYTLFKVPAGTYLISKDSTINMVSNMTFLLDDKAILQEESNNYSGYSVISVGRAVHDVTIKGGTYEGDRNTHDFSKGGTQESGYGILMQGVQNVTVDGVKSENFTGDGLLVGGAGNAFGKLSEGDLESGSIDDQGNLVMDSTAIRTKSTAKTLLTGSLFQDNPTFQFDHAQNIDAAFDVYFYRADGTFISSVKDNGYGSRHNIEIPDGANYFYTVFHTPSIPNGFSVELWNKLVSSNVTIQNSELDNNRRQGISVTGANGVVIQNNNIHDQNGTAPQSGIDSEGGGFYPNDNLRITTNKIYDNKGLNIVLADGDTFKIDGNYLGYIHRPQSISLAISPHADHSTVTNNTFDHGSFQTWKDTTFSNNKLINTKASLSGENINIDSNDFTDSGMNLTGTVPMGMNVSNITMRSTAGVNSPFGGIGVYGEAMHLSNITFDGDEQIGGNGNDANIYDNVTYKGVSPKDTTFAPGTYNNCSVTGKSVELKYAGKTIFNQCHFVDTTLYTYSKDTDATIQNSTFDFTKENPGNVILAMQAKNISVVNNTINDPVTTKATHAIIQIGRDAWANHLTDVYAATVKGNEIHSNIQRIGISTTNGGTNAPAYDIEDNTLSKATLDLKANDINENNQLN